MQLPFLSPRFMRFGIAGLLATLIHVVTFSILVELFLIPPVIAAIPAFILAMLSSYVLNHQWTFQVSGLHHIHLPKYMIVAIIGLSMNVLITYFVVNILAAWYGIALALVVVTVPVITFWFNQKWTFKPASAPHAR